jgi:hypothetical protein
MDTPMGLNWEIILLMAQNIHQTSVIMLHVPFEI